MRFRCHFDHYPVPEAPNSFINHATIDVLCADEDGCDCLVARLAIDHLDLVRTELAGENVFQVCDADSGGWEAVYSALFEAGQDFVELRRDFDFDNAVDDVLFLHQSVFHHSVHAWRMFILDHAARLFGETSALVMWHDETEIPHADLARLGFRRIAGHDLLFRPNMLKNNYDASVDAAGVSSIEVDSRAADEVEDEWQRKSNG